MPYSFIDYILGRCAVLQISALIARALVAGVQDLPAEL